MTSKLAKAIDSRLGAGVARRIGLSVAGGFKRYITARLGWQYTLVWAGLAALYLLVLSGILVLVYYRPTANQAYESISYIADNVRFGWLAIQVHRWATGVLVFVLGLAIARDFVLANYKFPGDFTWLMLIGIFGVVLGFTFTGRVLPWDQHAYHSTMISTEIARSLWFPGELACYIIRGGKTVSSETITRFLVLHILCLPTALVVLGATRIFFVSLTAQALDNEGRGMKGAVETQIARGAVVFCLTILLIFTGAFVFPLLLDVKADPRTVPDLLKPEWYFLPLHQLTKFLPSWVCALVGLIVPVLLGVLPFVDRNHSRNPADRKKCISIAALILAGTLLLGIVGHLSGRERTYFGKRVRFSMDGIPTLIGEESQNDESED
ncbi:MAG: cytochrome b N-terminal domain-containing protein [Planctomycetota bacterium]|nr:cytochrome b N-terminal domain-containing protein [Planctomycetota bacterium]MDA1138109.1 cytochrome b N-terminal domain-containing protein [Planctomycetota bacterium]